VSSPPVSIALLVRNGMPKLGELLKSLAAQQGVGEFEIVAVDSGSTDGSLEALAAAGAVVHRIEPAAFSFGPTRQLAFSLTQGRVIVTLSQDTLPDSTDWLRAMTEPILDGRFDIVQSREAAPREVQLKLNVYNCTNLYPHWSEPYVNLSCAGMAISRVAWAETGFGAVVMSEDKYLARAAMERKLRMTFAEGVKLLHGHEYTAVSLAKRAFNEGVGAQKTDGRYSLLAMVRDLFRFQTHKTAVSAVLKYRAMSVPEAVIFPVRPIFLYVGYRFGRKYWG